MAHIYVNSKLSISFLYLAGISILSQIIHKYSQVTEQIFYDNIPQILNYVTYDMNKFDLYFSKYLL